MIPELPNELPEGFWTHKIYNRGRVAIPSKIANRFGKYWIVAIDPNLSEICLFPQRLWERKLAKSEKPEEIRANWYPQIRELDTKMRLIIPVRLRKKVKLKETILMVSMCDRLVVKNIPIDEVEEEKTHIIGSLNGDVTNIFTITPEFIFTPEEIADRNMDIKTYLKNAGCKFVLMVTTTCYKIKEE